MLRRIKNESGYTIIEVMVVLGIVMLLSVLLMSGAGGTSKLERFSGEVRAFANVLREAQTKGYTVSTGACAASTECYWRGNVLEFQENSGSYNLYLLRGQDLSPVTGNIDQTRGISARVTPAQQSYNLDQSGLTLENIIYTRFGTDSYPTSVSIAFLAPDGTGYSATSIGSFAGDQPYTEQAQVTFILRDQATGTVGAVRVNTESGRLQTAVGTTSF